MSLEAQGAERAIVSILYNHPDKLFEVNDVLSRADFINTGSGMIFDILKDIILKDDQAVIDKHLIFAEAERKNIEGFFHHTLNGELVEAIANMNVSPNNFSRFVADVKQCSIKRALVNKCSDLKESIEGYVGPSVELRNMVENSILDSLRHLDTGKDGIINLSEDFEEIINAYADRQGAIGVDIGFDRWQKDVGYIRNGAITGIFASTKVGKSQFSMWAMFQTAILQRKPVLYLDTELQARQQQMRLCGVISGIPFDVIESGAWKSDEKQIAKIKKAFEIVKNAPIYYKNIAGMSLGNVIPTIRKFTYQHLGGPIEGDDAKGLVIYDYIKLMDKNDMNDLQEYQLIGLLMSSLHDCCANLNIPIMALGQLNKQGDIGIHRISHNVDSATILRPKTPEERQEDGPQRGSHVLEVKYSRNGCGHDYDEWVNLFFDKSCGQFKEDKRASEMSSVISNLRDKAKDKLEREATQKLSDAREDSW
jgi:replicative DNA helicase